MFTQSADHDNEDLKQSDRQQQQQQQQQLQQDNYKELPKITQTNFASACYGCDSLSQLSSSSSNPNTCTPTTSNKSSLSSPPPPPPQPSSQNLQHPQQPLQSQPSEYRNLTTSGFATSNEGGSSSLSSTASSSPPPQPPPPAPPRHDSQATHNSHLRFHPSGTSTSSSSAAAAAAAAAASTAGTSIENNSDEQWQCSGRQTPPGSSSLHQSDVYRLQPQLLQSSSSAAQFAQQRHHRNRNSHPPQSQLLKWQGNDVVTAPNINRASATNVNHHIRSEPLFSNLDNTSTLVKPFQEEQLTTLQTAIRAMSWNSLRHDHLYRFRHNSYSGQDYYRHLYQQQQQRRSQSSSKHQGMEAASGGYNQDSHATKMMKLDGGSSITAPVAQPSNVSAKQQYPHSGSQLRVRSVQQIRYQHPPIRLNSKELKENYTDELVKYEDKIEGKDDQHQHLVKTISDLPIFVTIEDFRVASYTIAGEPHLCLPQLLQFLRQHFDTKTMVEKFEESLIHFPSATPKQVEGFIKSSCLPPSAKSCPLIKRSDADKICLSLFEELSNVNDKKPLSDIVSICSKQQKNRDQEIYSDNPNKSNSIEAGSNCGETAINKIDPSEKASASNQDKSDPSSSIHDDVNDINSASKTQSQENIVQQEKNTSVIVADDSNDKYATVKKKLKCNSDESDTPKSESSSTQDASEDISSRDADKSEQIESSHDKISSSDGDVKQQDQRDEIRPSSVSSGDATTRDGLFDTEAQSSILNFARAVTSTLMIRIYHRCFGKCVGSFYPSLLKDKQMECIQCSTCKVMLTPRRFVGHTHGPKENEVCHWGFNSYNWRSYIRLSKKQQMNNLDEDELLHQFNTLTTLANELTERPPPAPIEQVPSENRGNTGRSCCATTSVAQVEPSYSQNLTRTKDIDSSSSIARSDRTMHQMPGNYACDESVSQTQPASNLATSGQNTSVSMMRRFNTTDKSSSLTLHAPSSSSISTLSGSKVSYNPKYVSRHVSSMDNRGSIRSARSASLSGRMPSSACCSGGDMSISTSNGFTAQHPQEYYGMARTMNHYSSPSAITNTTAPGLFNQPNQLTEDLRNFLLQNWSPSTNSNPQPQHPAATQLPMLPLAPMSLPVTAGQVCNPMPPMDVARPARSTNEDLTKHLSLSPESKRELYVCTNLSTYLSRRGLSAGMTGDIVEKVLNLMRESRSTL